MTRQLLGITIVLTILTFVAINVSATYNHYRLPTAIQPDAYKIKIVTFLENNASYVGLVSIHFEVLESTSNITLHVRNLNIDESQIDIQNDRKWIFDFCRKDIETVPQYDYYIIHLCEPLQKGEKYTVTLYFSGILKENLEGYYLSSYVDKETNQKRWLSVTDFEPTNARSAFPCFDEPIYKAKFTIWLGHHKSLTAISNMPLERRIPLNVIDNLVWSIFEESVPMSTYLVAFSVNDFAYVSSPPTDGSNVVFRTWAQKAQIDQCNYATDIAPKVLKYYEELFGIDFPLRKLDAIAIPDFSNGAMENWGLITYKESKLLYSPQTSTEKDKAAIAQTIAHELAHQWFGNLVTMKWWSDLWLNEGFATYVSTLAVHDINPEWNYYNEDNLNNMQTVLYVDMKKSSHPISQTISDTNDINNRFDDISYKKGSAVLRMMHMFMGTDLFFLTVQRYLKIYEYQNAEQDDLWEEFTNMAYRYEAFESEFYAKPIMDSWTLQSGYPVLNITRNYKTGSIQITQQRYMESPDISEEESKKCWWVPLSYTTASELDFEKTKPKAWLECNKSGKSVTLTLNNVTSGNEWILFNIQYAGIYRVMYDTENWSLLKDVLNSERFSDIPVLNRVQLIDDAFSLAKSGHQDYDVAFDLLDYLRQERDNLVWTYSLSGIGNIIKMLQPFDDLTNDLRTYLRHIIKPIYYELGGLNDTVADGNNSHSRLVFKETIARLACLLEQKDCISTAKNYLHQWKSSDNPSKNNIIPVNLRPTVLNSGVDSEDFEFLLQRFMESNVATERNQLLIAMTTIRNETILYNLLNKAFDKSSDIIRKSETILVLARISSEKIGFPVAWKYIIQNMDYLKEFYGPLYSYMCSIMEIISGNIVTSEALDTFKSFIETHKEYFSQCPNNIEKALENINVNMKWIEKNIEKIREILKTRISRIGKDN